MSANPRRERLHDDDALDGWSEQGDPDVPMRYRGLSRDQLAARLAHDVIELDERQQRALAWMVVAAGWVDPTW